ncbi:MAG: sensor histidine kinase [Thermoleophilaceae bacterium]
MRLRYTTFLTAAAAALVTLLVSVIPAVHLAYMSPAGHVAIETAAGLIALLVAYLVLGRFLRTGEPCDLALTAALAVLGFTNLLFSSIPLAASSGAHRFSTWAPVAGRLLGAFLFALAAFVRGRRLNRPRRAVLPVMLACVGALAAIAVVFAVAAPHLPFGINPALSPTSPDRPRVVGNPTVLVVQIVSGLLYAIAAIGFVRRQERTGDPLLVWFAIGSVLAAFSHVNYFLFPSLYSNWVYMGDFLRLAFYLVLLAGAGREIAAYQQRMGEAAALEERRRLARELHDGLAQELAFISTQSRWLSQSEGADRARLDQLALAAARALDESRGAIAALTRPLDEPLEVAVAQAAEEVADRVGVKVKLDLEPGVEVTPTTRAALVRIVREAVTNTARHAQASEVTVSLATDGQLALQISDNGVGFDPAAESDGWGFGLMSMRERAQAIGAELEVHSRVGEGTRIEVMIP